ncbi:MAG: glycoside hydrolase family 19 protein [Candidatus Methylumidiphilus sp.]
MDISQLKAICPIVKNADDFVPALNDVFAQYEFNTPNRIAMFLAQCLHESGGFKYVREIWGPTAWQKKYEGHKGLGNTHPGDGHKYMGRGLIQVTGRANYTKFSEWLGEPDIIDQPQKLEEPKLAVLSAVWFWVSNDLNEYADKGDIEGCTRRVNGPKMLGLAERKKYYQAGLAALKAE